MMTLLGIYLGLAIIIGAIVLGATIVWMLWSFGEVVSLAFNDDPDTLDMKVTKHFIKMHKDNIEESDRMVAKLEDKYSKLKMKRRTY